MVGFPNIKNANGSVIISVSREIYPDAKICQAADAFAHLGKISVGEQVKITPKDQQDAGEIGYEFCTYLTALMKKEM